MPKKTIGNKGLTLKLLIGALSKEIEVKIQCDKCKTCYTINEDKVPDTGTNVQCLKCRCIIRVMKPELETSKISPTKEIGSSNKKCPYCAEIIKAEAVVCRFCTRDIKEEEKRIERNKNQPRTAEQNWHSLWEPIKGKNKPKFK